MSEKKLKIGVSIGDVNGIGLEVIIKTFADNRITDFCTPIVYGNTKIASYYRKNIGLNDFSFHVINHPDQANDKRANMINCWDEDVKITPGEENETGGKYAFLSLEAAMNDLLDGKLDALVTAPINKNSIQSEAFKFPGHTEYLQSRTGASDSLMFMISDDLRIGVVTGHIPLKDVSQYLSSEQIVSKLQLMNQCLRNDFWIEKPKIAVLGLNPHAGDHGLIGTEEKEIIQPAIERAQELDIFAFGPYPADGFFAGNNYKNFDGILAMYHDQGLIPFKYIASHRGINFTAGLPIVRTSPDHGTAFDIAGKNMASADSFRSALFAAINIVKQREEQKTLLSNRLKTKRLSKDRD
ncbi:4-hydroxythreonine-4-phosphate dehydrogenase PdxA [Albibacterium indicum]|uniref:4-hydroxythreonine-4-phosphate dehydrogenase PdxA n=1 Tax=Albibacterium indicum TaxID=2292082 RepID=UPI000E557906|nr:4-hydroxythreonine-4-phosphate dehydrogenase PdxA [Pedobacter indicus]